MVEFKPDTTTMGALKLKSVYPDKQEKLPEGYVEYFTKRVEEIPEKEENSNNISLKYGDFMDASRPLTGHFNNDPPKISVEKFLEKWEMIPNSSGGFDAHLEIPVPDTDADTGEENAVSVKKFMNAVDSSTDNIVTRYAFSGTSSGSSNEKKTTPSVDNANFRDVYRYNEGELMKEMLEYINSTYSEHYQTPNQDHIEDLQCIDAIIALGDSLTTFRDNSMKYIWRVGRKGDNKDSRKDVKKIIHYCLFILYVMDLQNNKK